MEMKTWSLSWDLKARKMANLKGVADGMVRKMAKRMSRRTAMKMEMMTGLTMTTMTNAY